MSWSDTEPIVLIDTTTLVKPRASAPARRLIQPAGYFDWSQWRDVTIQLLIDAAEGNPGTWSMTPQLMFGIAHTQGNIYRQPRWYYPDAATVANCVVGGQFFPTVTDATPLPFLAERTIRGPLKRLMAIDLGDPGSPSPFTMSGPTTAGLRVALLASPGRTS